MKERVLVLGASGLLGSNLVPYLRGVGYDVGTIGRTQSEDFVLPSVDYLELTQIFKRFNPTHLVNLIAATNVDECEKNLNMAVHANVLIPRQIKKALQGTDIHAIHFSSDQVYGGGNNYSEGDIQPLNIYGLTKLAGEAEILSSTTTILRTNFFGKSNCSKMSFSDWIVSSLRNNQKITLFDDVIFNPISIRTLCSMVDLVISSKVPGVFNLGAKDSISKAHIGIQLASSLGLNINKISIGKVSESDLYAIRPKNMFMDVSSFESNFGIKAPLISDEVIKVTEEYLYD